MNSIAFLDQRKHNTITHTVRIHRQHKYQDLYALRRKAQLGLTRSCHLGPLKTPKHADTIVQ